MLSLLLWAITFAVTFVTGARAQTPPDFKPFSPSYLGVTFPNHIKVPFAGFELPAADGAAAPSTLSVGRSIGKEGNSTFMVFMIDMDIVFNGTATTVLHWYEPSFHYNLETLSLDPSNNPSEQAGYASPTPPVGDTHRYVLVLFPQPSTYLFPTQYEYILPLTMEARLGFDLEKFARDANLGEPIAGNYFRLTGRASTDKGYLTPQLYMNGK